MLILAPALQVSKDNKVNQLSVPTRESTTAYTLPSYCSETVLLCARSEEKQEH